MRPAAEMGPIILCLDTSASMAGDRERIAKALALEVLRGAHRQGRQAYLYAFSGPQQVEELELKCDPGSLNALLSFLAGSFQGGTGELSSQQPPRCRGECAGVRGWGEAEEELDRVTEQE